MRLFWIVAASLLLFGCLMGGTEENTTENVTVANDTQDNIMVLINASDVNDTINVTNMTNVTEPEPKWERYDAGDFSFEYPINMETQEANGLFTGEHVISTGTGEILVVMFYNTSKVYGENQDKEFRERPSETATDLLMDDMEEDPIQMLDDAYDIGEISEFSIARDAHVSHTTFKIKFGDSDKTYYGHAISIYVPAYSLHIKYRGIALNSQLSDNMKNQFLLSFRLQ